MSLTDETEKKKMKQELIRFSLFNNFKNPGSGKRWSTLSQGRRLHGMGARLGSRVTTPAL
jgi:hypothetical protein